MYWSLRLTTTPHVTAWNLNELINTYQLRHFIILRPVFGRQVPRLLTQTITQSVSLDYCNSLTGVAMLLSAPWSSSILTISAWSPCEAMYRAVNPAYNISTLSNLALCGHVQSREPRPWTQPTIYQHCQTSPCEAMYRAVNPAYNSPQPSNSKVKKICHLWNTTCPNK